MRIYLVGQNNFGNRGCEALVRSTVAAIRSQFTDAIVHVPALDIERDSRQWPEAADAGACFVRAPVVPSRFVNWERLCRRVPVFARMRWPRFVPDADLLDQLKRCDAVLSIGGDNYSLDYGLASVFFFAGIANYALELGKPVVLWGASVGPFGSQPAVERQMIEHLSRLTLITVREPQTRDYLARIGITENVVMASDSAFALEPEAVDTAGFWPKGARRGVVGVNVSPLVDDVRREHGVNTALTDEVARFIRQSISDGYSVLLVPHVIPLAGSERNNDESYLRKIAAAAGVTDGTLCVAPGFLSAPQLKYVISRCRYFIGARTHATIAALSTGVPTISIAYSVKARGINLDLFGHDDYVLDSLEAGAATLAAALKRLARDEQDVREILRVRVPECKRLVDVAAAVLKQRLGNAMHLA